MRGAFSIFMLLALCASVFAYCGDGNCELGTICTDSDPYQNPYLLGIVNFTNSTINQTITDECVGGFLRQYGCVDAKPYWYSNEYCPNGCVNGACLAEPPSCTDTDGGGKLYDFGLTYGFNQEGVYNLQDTCLDSTTIQEHWCSGTELITATFDCTDYDRDGCFDGVCRNAYENCGDGLCRGNENYMACPSDCVGENEFNCPADCLSNATYCGDGLCSDGETCATCPQDCGVCGQPDLTVSSMTYSPLGPLPGTVVVITSTITNMGNASVSGFYVNTSAGPVYSNCLYYVGSTLGPGQSYNTYCNYTASAEQNPNTASTYVDPTATIQESDETNNYMQISIPVRTCTPSWYCSNSRTRAYRAEDCRVTTFPCGANYCCVNGKCKKDLSGKCNTIIQVAASAEMAQASGPPLKGQLLFVYAAVAIVAIATYLYVHLEFKT